MNACMCVVGWHYCQEFFDKLPHLPALDVFIVSHRPPEEIPESAYRCVASERILIEPNLGYDWGAYQQFIDRGLYANYEFVFFAHDDISILDPSVFEVCTSIIAERNGNCVVGNGRVSTKRDWPLTHIQCYAHSLWKPPSWEFYHDIVRGSFLATSSQALNRIGHFEIYWDRRGYLGVGAGNWSLRATCGRIQSVLGDDAFAFLSETYRSSPYVREMERGQAGTRRTRPSLYWMLRYRLILGMSRTLMTWYMNSGSPSAKQRLAGLMIRIYRSL